MKRIECLTKEVLKNISAPFVYPGKPLRILQILVDEKPVQLTVARIGEIDKFSLGGNPQLILTYIDGYGGAIHQLPGNTLMSMGRSRPVSYPMEIVEDADERSLLMIDPRANQIYPKIVYNEQLRCYGYGGYVGMKEKFVRVDQLNHQNPIVLHIPALKVNLQEIIDLGHPNLILMKYPSEAGQQVSELLCFDASGKERITLHRNWREKRTKDYGAIAEIIDQQERLYLVKDSFTEWWEDLHAPTKRVG